MQGREWRSSSTHGLPSLPAAAAPAYASAPAPAPAPAATPPTPAPVDPHALVFVEEEGDGSVAIFQAGTIKYAVTMRSDGNTIRNVVIRAHGKSCNHNLDLAVAAARERTAGNAARQVGLPATTIVKHLVQILAGVQAREEARLQAPVMALSDEERAVGTALLTDPTLLDRVADDLTTLGWIGENQTKKLLFLVSISRLLPQPLWAVYRSTGGAAPWQALGCIAALTPAEACTRYHRVTDAALTQADPASLRHHLLVVDQAETIRPEATLALRILKERGGVGLGGHGEARGPVAVLAAAAGEIDHRCRDCFMPVSVDESPEQTERILSEQRERLGAPPAKITTQAAVVARHHAAQRLLERMPVSIPFFKRIVFPGNRVRHRDEQRWFLGLIAASALLHQRQRTQSDGVVLASEADFSIAQQLVQGIIGIGGDGLSRAARDLLAAVERMGLETFIMADLPAILPEATVWTVRAALKEAVDFGYLHSPSAGRGRQRSYSLGDAKVRRAVGIHLRAIDATDADHQGRQVGEFEKVRESTSSNLNRCAV
jgi:hypothetical protein